MKRIRFPIVALMAIIALLALELGSLRVATEGYVDATRYLTVSTLATATYLARHRKGDRGEWWFGFALFGWAYFALMLDAVGRRGFAVAMSHVPFNFAPSPFLPPATILGLLGGESASRYSPGLTILLWNRYEILQSILTLIVALAGGIVCWTLGRLRGAPYREVVPHAGRLDLDDKEPGP
jgi:hypothetical protein